MKGREKLAAYAVMTNGNWSAIAAHIHNHTEPQAIVKDAYITVLDDLYPAALRTLRYPPWVLFYRGNAGLLKIPAVSIVGSRNACEYGLASVHRIITVLGTGFVYVSGLAKGIDAAVHREAIISGAHTIGVIGSGLGTVYPRENSSLNDVMGNDQLILSEYPHDTGIRRDHFPWRNRIIAALGNPLIVAQAALKSGTMLTVNEALALSRDVCCVPYPYGSGEGAGCNLLISQGAQILYDDEQLILLAKSVGSTLS